MRVRDRSIPRLASVLAGVLLLGGSAAAVAVHAGHPGKTPAHAATVAAVAPAPARYNPEPSREAGPVPVRLRIPAIGVDAAIERVGVTAGFQMGVPADTNNAGWYGLGSSPGRPGDAVIAGHLDDRGGNPAVFAGLGRLKAGDTIEVLLTGGTSARFNVRGTSSVPYTSNPPGLFETEGPARLTLITCAGAYDTRSSVYTQRLVVDAQPAN